MKAKAKGKRKKHDTGDSDDEDWNPTSKKQAKAAIATLPVDDQQPPPPERQVVPKVVVQIEPKKKSKEQREPPAERNALAKVVVQRDPPEVQPIVQRQPPPAMVVIAPPIPGRPRSFNEFPPAKLKPQSGEDGTYCICGQGEVSDSPIWFFRA